MLQAVIHLFRGPLTPPQPAPVVELPSAAVPDPAAAADLKRIREERAVLAGMVESLANMRAWIASRADAHMQLDLGAAGLALEDLTNEVATASMRLELIAAQAVASPVRTVVDWNAIQRGHANDMAEVRRHG